MRLFIAEKPSMAGEIAKCLGTAIKKDGYWGSSSIRVMY